MPGRILEYTTTLLAPPDEVFAALTRAEHLERWFCDQATSDPRHAGILTMKWNRESSTAERYVGRWDTFDPPRACGFTGGHTGYPNRDAGHIEFRLESDGPGTCLRTRHAFPTGPEYDAIAARYESAWERALERLAHHLAPQG